MATLKDVAEKAGVTITTVSRILNNRGYISDKTRAKVYAAMKELNYHPNEIARSLIKKRTNIIGVIVPSIRLAYFSQIIHFLEIYAAKRNYRIMLFNSHNQYEKELDNIGMLRSNKVAGIVMCSLIDNDIDLYLSEDLPIVSIECLIRGDTSSVLCDNYQGGQLATNHLLECGCQNLICIGSKLIDIPAYQRIVAFEEICKKQGCSYKIYNHSEQQFFLLGYRDFIAEILNENPHVDGIFVSSDLIALQIIQECFLRNIRIPEDLKIVGFDDIELASLCTPPLTTIKQPIEQMCELAINIILNRVDEQIVPCKSILPVALIKRGTTLLD